MSRPGDSAEDLGREAQRQLYHQLAATVLEAYDLGQTSIELLEQKTNVTFRVAAGRPARHYVLRICQPGGYTPEEIESEARWLHTLRHEWGMAVPEPVAARDRSLVAVTAVAGLAEPRCSVLFRWLPGTLLESSLSPERAHQVGQLLGRLHRCSEAFVPPPGFTRPTWDCERLFGRGAVIPDDVHSPLITRRSREDLDRAARLVRRQVEPLGRDPEVFGLIHKDLEPDNTLLHKGVLHAIDFADCGWGYYPYDVAAALLPLHEKKGFQEMRVAFLEGYQSVRPLRDEHLALIDTFTIARCLFAVRLMVLETMKIPRVRDYAAVAIPHILGEVRRFVARHDGGGGAAPQRMTTIQFLSRMRDLGVRLWAEAETLRFTAPRGALTPALRAELKERKGELLAFLAQGQAAARASAPTPSAEDGPAPLSFAQQRLWFIDQLLPGSVEYNIARAVRLSGPVRAEVLEESLNEVMRRHDALRTHFASVDGQPVQVIAPPSRRPLPLVDLAALPVKRRRDEAERLAGEAAHRPFDLSRGPLMRVTLLRLEPEEHVAVSTMHHVIGDGWATGLLFREMAVLYQAFAQRRRSPLPELPIQYADFARWQRRHLQGEVLEEQLSYWRRQLAGAPQVLALPTDRPPAAMRSVRGDRHRLLIPRRLADRLKALGQEQGGATLFMALFAAFNALLCRYTEQQDVLVGCPIANRNRTEIEGLIGFFVNTLVLRTRLSGNPSYRELLDRVRRTTLEAYAHQDLPFEMVVEELRPPRKLRETPLFQVTFSLQNVPTPDAQVSSFRMSLMPPISRAVEFNLSCDMKEMPEGVRTSLKYREELFDATTIARLGRHYLNLLEEVANHPERRLHEIAVLSPAQRHQLLNEWNDDAGAATGGACLHQLFEAQVERTPAAGAVVAGDRVWTYRQLNRRANRVARQLRCLGVGPEVRVGILMERSPEMVAAILGVLKAGGAYLPLDPSYPPERLAWMLRDAQAPGLVTRFREPPAGYAGWVLDPDAAELAAGSDERPAARPSPAHLAYVIYTSGSTGRPKGVAICHHSAAVLVAWSRQVFADEEVEAVLAATSICFDLSIFELFVPLSRGGRVILAADALELTALGGKRVTLVNTVPSVMAELLAAGGLPVSVRTVNLAGEALSGALVGRIREQPSVDRVFNLYGPSEDTTYSTWALVRRGEPAPPIGRAVANTRAYVLAPDLRPVPPGVVGEIHLAGDGLARSYLGRPGRTAASFLPDPFSPRGGERLYRTGDRGRWRATGELEFLGRLDQQIKLRGFRIELGEIEAVLATSPAVRQAAVAAREIAPGDVRLAAWVVPAAGAEPAAGQLRAFLQRRLPDYMVPAAIALVDELPRTPSGKLDRRALPQAMPAATAAGRFAPPHGPTEEILAGIWRQVLRVERVGRDDNFFDLGGHSLLATQAVARVQKLLGVELPVSAFFETPTPATMAESVAAARPGDEPLPPVEPVARDRDFPLSFAQERLWFLDRLEPGAATYNMPSAVRLRGPLKIAALGAALAELVRRHESLRTTFEMVDGTPRQRISRPSAPPLPVIDLGALPPRAAGREATRIAARHADRRFDLASGPLLAAALVRLGDQLHHFLLVTHHIVSDGWSLGVLVHELAALYAALVAGEPSPLPPLRVQYADFAVWQRRNLAGKMDRELAWWSERLGDVAPLDLPTDRARPAVQSYRGERLERLLPPESAAPLRAFSRAEGVTLFMTLLAAAKVLLQRWSGRDDVVVGAPIAGRRRLETEGLIGCFLNTLVLRTDLGGRPSFRRLLARVREVTLGAYAHQDVPFEALLERLQPQRDLSRTPLFQVLFNMLNFPAAEIRLPQLTVESLASTEIPSKFDMTFYLADGEDGIRIQLVYNADLFDRARMAELLDQFVALLERAVERPEEPIDAASLVTAAARAVLPDPRERLDAGWVGAVHELFAARAERFPERPAVVTEVGVRSYGALEAASNRLAGWLRSRGVGRGDRVAIFAHRSPPLVEAILAVLKAGGVFAILDPAWPGVRLAEIVRQAAPRAWLHVAGAGPVPVPVAERLQALDCPRLDVPAAELAAARRPAVAVGPDDPACLVFTSGSTGTPRGILGRHGSLSHFLPWLGERFALCPADRFSLLSGLAHDPLQRDLFTPLCLGAAIAVPNPDHVGVPGRLAAWMARAGVTVAHLTPAMARLLTEPPGGGEVAAMPALRLVLLVGEALTRHDVARLRRHAPAATCVNLYGSTETQRAVAFHVVGDAAEAVRSDPQTVPLGRGMKDVQLLVLNRRLALAGIGELGEIAVRSPHLALGYLGDGALTAERFLMDPFALRPGERIYRTGDLGRYRPDGEVDFAGRADRQVNVRGFRVEPAEIEAALAALPEVAAAAVTVRRDGAGENLAAYVVPDGGREVAPRSLRRALGERLPSYMVPALFVTLERLPLTPNGKIDYRALPPASAEARGRDEAAEALPRTPAEELVAGIFAELLKRGRVAPGDDFFELGGHSLLATRLLSRVRETFAVELPLRAVFETPAVAGLAARIEEARRAGAGLCRPPLRRVARDGELPPSFAQQRLWFLHQLDRSGTAYTIPAAVVFAGPLNVAALAASLDEVVRRHDALRTHFATVAGELVQVVASRGAAGLAVADLRALPGPRRRAEARRLARRELRRPFDLASGPLLRATLVELAADDRVLLLAMHHVVSDGWSMGVLVRELGTLYAACMAGRPSPLAELEIQYPDFARWQRRWLAGEVLAAETDWWRNELAGMPEALDLPADRPRPAVQTFAGAHLGFRLSRDLAAALRELSRQRRTTLFMTLLAAFQTLLHRYTGRGDVAVGTPIAGRNQVETEGLIGVFINTLVLRTRLGGDPSFAALLERVREVALEAYAHQEVPFEKLVEELQPRRDLSRSPLFQVMFALRNVPMERVEIPGLELSALEVETGISKFDLTLEMAESSEGLTGSLEYNRDLFDAATIRRLARHFENLVQAAAAGPETVLSALPLLAGSERHQLLAEWSDTGAEHGWEVPIHRRIEAQAARRPEAVAVQFEDRHWSYRELDRRAGGLARQLRRLGVGPEVPVAVCLERSPEMVAAVLAVMKAGGAYLPLDPAHPRQRREWILDDTGRPLVVGELGTAELAPSTQDSSSSSSSFCPHPTPSPPTSPSSSSSSSFCPHPTRPSQGALAYVIYTSGSTGRPKGVQVTHAALSNFLASMARQPGLAERDVLVAVTTLSFDIAALELLLPLAVGARLVVASREVAGDGPRLARLLRRSGATVMQATPATWSQLLAAGWRPAAGFKVLCGGEALGPELAADLSRDGGELWNLYGPTETTIWSAVERVEPAAVTIGRPIAETSIRLLDRRLRPVPVGVPGELAIGGAGLARGYLGRPALTAERFVPDPAAREPGRRLYRTGDLARALPDGRIACLGRLDDQVKIRGFRIELGEIEAALAEHPGVRRAVVAARGLGPGDQRLIAWVVAAGEAPPTISQLRRFLARRLPDYMLPSAVVGLEALPLNASGKVDRRALPLPSGERPELERAFVAPQSEIEVDLAWIWGEILGLAKVGVDDNFFDLGGHSLLLVQVHERIRQEHGVELSMLELFEHPTVRSLARRLAGAGVTESDIGAGRAEALERGKALRRRRLAQRRGRTGTGTGTGTERDLV